MREAPTEVVKRLRSYDPLLGVAWDVAKATWYFTWKGQRLFPWNHRDGTPARNIDGLADEAVHIVQDADNRLSGAQRIRNIERNIARQRELDERDKETAMASAHAYANDLARVKINGPKVFA